MNEAPSKLCPQCGETKPLDAFNVARRERDGRRSECRECTRGWMRRKRQEDAYRKYNREYSEAYRRKDPEKYNRNLEKTHARHPEKRRARKAIHNAVARGKIEKPTTCDECGQQVEKRRLHAHHEDYSKPLDVRWLCIPCHQKADRAMRDQHRADTPDGGGEGG